MGGHHHEEHHGSSGKELTFEEKGGKLLDHWIQHNNDHIESYRRWALEFRNHQCSEIADLLESVVELTGRINENLHAAAVLISAQTSDPKQ